MIELLTEEQIRANMQASAASRAPAMSTAIDTDEGVMIEVGVDSVAGLQHQIHTVEDDAILSKDTSTEALDKHADAHFEGGRIPAQPTRTIEAALAVTGVAASVIPVDTPLVHSDGSRYKIATAATIPSGGTVYCDVVSISTGAVCNKEAGELLSFESPPAGVDSSATLVLDLSGAADQESDPHLLDRLIDVIRNPHAGGRASDYRQWAMEVARVDHAFVYCPSSYALTSRRGLGTTDIAILMAGEGLARIPSADLLAEVTAFIESMRPTGAADHRELAPIPITQAFDIRVAPEAGYEFDWDSTTNYTVASWTAGTKSLQWSAAVPSVVVAGKRLLVKGQLCTVVSVAGDVTVVDTALAGTGAGNKIWPAGPLTQAVIDAVQAYCDGLGPARGLAYDREQPGWDDTIRKSKLFKAVVSLAGVLDAEISTPATNVTPTDLAPAGGVQVLVAGLIEVRPLAL